VVGVYEKKETNEKESNEEGLMETNENREKKESNGIKKKSVTNYSPATYHIKHNVPGSVVKQFLRGGVCELYPTFCPIQCYLH
jgi:hypothetical protein